MPFIAPEKDRKPAGGFTAPTSDVSKKAPTETPWSDVPMNAVRDVRDIAIGLPMLVGMALKKRIELPQDVITTAMQLAQGKKIKETELSNEVRKFWELEKGMLEGIKEEVTHPIESFKKRPVSTASDILGIAVPAARGVSQLAKGAATGKFAAELGKRALSAGLGPSLEDINTRFARNAEVANAKPFDVLAREIPDDVQRLSKTVGEQSDAALSTLRKSKYMMEGAAAKDSILNAIKKAKEGLGRGISDSTVRAKKALDRYGDRLRKLGNTVSENELGSIIRDMDNDINWDAPELKPLNSSLESVRSEIDTILKSSNPEYKEAMIPVAENTRLLKKAKRLFSLRKSSEGLEPSNATAAALKGSIKETRIDSQDVLGRLKEVTGRDYLREAENAATAEAFSGMAPRTRRINLPTLVGTGVGSLIGGAFGGGPGGVMGAMSGGMAGHFLDSQGARLSANIIDAIVRRRLAQGTPGGITPLLELLQTPALPISATSRLVQEIDKRKKRK